MLLHSAKADINGQPCDGQAQEGGSSTVQDVEEGFLSMSMSPEMVAATSAADNAPAPPSSELSSGKNADIIPPQLHLDCGAVVSVPHTMQKAHSDGGSSLGTWSAGTGPGRARAYSDGGSSMCSTKTDDAEKENSDRNQQDVYSSVGVGSIAQALGSWNISMGKDDKGETVLFVQRGDSKVALRFDQNAIKVADPNGESTVPKDDRTRKPPASPSVRKSSYLESLAARNASPVTRVRRSDSNTRSKQKSAYFEATESRVAYYQNAQTKIESPQVSSKSPRSSLRCCSRLSPAASNAGSQCPLSSGTTRGSEFAPTPANLSQQGQDGIR